MRREGLVFSGPRVSDIHPACPEEKIIELLLTCYNTFVCSCAEYLVCAECGRVERAADRAVVCVFTAEVAMVSLQREKSCLDASTASPPALMSG